MKEEGELPVYRRSLPAGVMGYVGAGRGKKGFSQIVFHRAGSRSDTDPSLNSEGARFEHRPLTANFPRVFVIFLSPAEENAGEVLRLGFNRFLRY